MTHEPDEGGSRPTNDVTTLVVLARGLGTRMRAGAPDAHLTEAQRAVAARGVKAMIDVGRPFLDHVLSEAADAGITDAVLVIGPEHDEIRQHYARAAGVRVHVDFAVQQQPLGTADALSSAAEAVGGRRFVMLNGDNFYPATTLRRVMATPGHALAGFEPGALARHSNIAAERIADFALLETRDGLLVDIHEKPDEVLHRRLAQAPVSMNCYVFAPSIFEHAGRTPLSHRGEHELPDAVRLAMAAGEDFHVVPSSDGVLDLSRQGDVAEVARRLADHPVRL